MSGYGEVVRETPNERYERRLAAVEAVLLVHWPTERSAPEGWLRGVAREILAAAETGI